LKNDHLEAVTHDHSLVQRLQEVGHLSAEEATVYRYRNVLLRAVGQEKRVEIDTYMRLLPQRDSSFYAATASAASSATGELKKFWFRRTTISEKVANLYDAAMAMGSNDNVTSILINFELK
jgi:serine/threonine protein phosphatase PrpC